MDYDLENLLNEGLLIGFDLDGVLCEIDIPFLRLVDNCEAAKQNSEKWYYRQAKPYLNPATIMTSKDKGVIITSRPTYLTDITKEWVRRYYPYMELHILGHTQCPPNGEDVPAWLDKMYQMKAKKIKELCVDVFIDDSPEVVFALRNCGIMAIQWGARIEGNVG